MNSIYFEIEIFCDIVNVFTVTFDLITHLHNHTFKFNASLLNKIINFLKTLLTPSFWMVVYRNSEMRKALVVFAFLQPCLV